MKVLKMGLIPAEDQEEMMKRFGSTIAYLEKKLGIKVEPFMATDYSGVIEAMRSKKVDVAFFGPFSYVLAADVANAEAFAVGVRSNGKSTYQSIIVAHKDSGIKTLNDLRGKDFVFVDPASTSGNLFPRVMLKKAGIDPEKDFKSVTYAGGHDAVELAIKNRKVPAGADNDITYEKMVKEGLISPEENIIIAKSDPIPGSPIAWRKDLPEDLKQKIKQAFLNMHNEDPQALSGYGEIIRYDEARDSDYNIIRETAKILNLDLKKMK
jgi:phosphonate transport system substrate-binding protein